MAHPWQVNSLALLALADWPTADGETVLAQIQHFVKYVHSHPNDYATVEKVSALVLDHEKADYAFATALYQTIGLPDDMTWEALNG